MLEVDLKLTQRPGGVSMSRAVESSLTRLFLDEPVAEPMATLTPEALIPSSGTVTDFPLRVSAWTSTGVNEVARGKLVTTPADALPAPSRYPAIEPARARMLESS